MIVGPRAVITDMSASTTTVRIAFSASTPPLACTTRWTRSLTALGALALGGAPGPPGAAWPPGAFGAAGRGFACPCEYATANSPTPHCQAARCREFECAWKLEVGSWEFAAAPRGADGVPIAPRRVGCWRSRFRFGDIR